MEKDSLFKLSPAFIAALLITLTIFVPVFAAPNMSPPNANVGANFYSVKAGDVLISNTGDISDSTGSVIINDPEGLRSTSTTSINPGVYGEGPGVGVYGKGNGATGTGGQFEGPTNGVTATSNRSGGAGGYFAGFGNVNRVTLSNSTYAIDAQGSANVNGNITANGHIKAAGGIGKFERWMTPSPLIPRQTYVTVISTCPTGQTIVSCGFSSNAPAEVWQLYQVYPSMTMNSCTVAGKNNSVPNVSYTINAEAICFDPNQ